MIRQWEITTCKNGELGTFTFNAESKVLALDHVEQLKYDIDFEYLHGAIHCTDNLNECIRSLTVRFIGWVEA